MNATRRVAVSSMLFSLCVACSPAPAPVSDVAVASNEVADVLKPSDVDEVSDRREFVPVEDVAPNSGELSDPRESLRVHNLALNTGDEGWRGAVEVLSRAGDAFTLEHLARVDRSDISEADAGQLERAVHAIRARVQQSGATLDASRVLAHLERTAYADLMCDFLEAELHEWTFKTIESQLEDPAVVAELKRLDASYTPTVEVETLFSSMSERVPAYIDRLLTKARTRP